MHIEIPDEVRERLATPTQEVITPKKKRRPLFIPCNRDPIPLLNLYKYDKYILIAIGIMLSMGSVYGLYRTLFSIRLQVACFGSVLIPIIGSILLIGCLLTGIGLIRNNPRSITWARFFYLLQIPVIQSGVMWYAFYAGAAGVLLIFVDFNPVISHSLMFGGLLYLTLAEGFLLSIGINYIALACWGYFIYRGKYRAALDRIASE
ncbi:MAG: hypothetical protein R3F48_09210 [Candidatus Zixiibacteriota bacterium]